MSPTGLGFGLGLGQGGAALASGPGGVTASLELWLKADAITGLNNLDPVTTWVNSSSQLGRDATQATAAKKPLYTTNIINGKPVVDFDGSNDFMRSTISLSITGWTIFAVVHPQLVGSNWIGVFTDTTTGFAHGIRAIGGQKRALTYDGATKNAVDTAPFVAGTSYYMTASAANGGVMELWTNGVLKDSIAVGTLWDAETSFDIGGANETASEFWNGYIAEIAVYSTKLSAGDRTTVEDYLKTKYGL